jgi:6-phosphogluconolactonase
MSHGLRVATVSLVALLAVACGGSSSKQPDLPRRLYSCDDTAPNAVSVYTVADDGALTPLDGSPFLTGGASSGFGGQSNCIRIHVASRRLFAVNSDSVSVFSIDENTGGLTLLPGSPSKLAEGRSPLFFSLDISGDGDAVFVADYDHDQVIVASVAADGSLTEVAGSPFATSLGAAVLELGLGGKYLYLQPQGDAIDAYQVAAGGSLSLLEGSPYDYGSVSGFTIRIAPGLDKLAVGGFDGVSIFTLDTATGQPTLVTGSPFAGPASVGALAWTPTGDRLYAGNWSGTELYGWSVASDGGLTPLTGSPWDLGDNGMSAMTFSSDGTFLFVAFDSGLAVFSVDAEGSLTEIAGSPFAEPGGSTSHLVFTP